MKKIISKVIITSILLSSTALYAQDKTVNTNKVQIQITQQKQKINIVAAENEYGSLAKIIGGDKVNVTSIINNADGDPHNFISSPSSAKKLEEAKIIIYNGAEYDTWVNPVLKTNSKAIDISAQKLVDFKLLEKQGEFNPHLWYDPRTFPAVAQKLYETYSKLDPKNKEYFAKNLKKFNTEYKKVYLLIDSIKEKYKGTKVTATAPLFGYMARALGLKMYGLDFQWTIMNGSEASPQMMIKYENLFKNKKVKILFYNEQVTDNVTKNILKLAKKYGVLVVGITETMPVKYNAVSWIIETLEKTNKALATVTKK